MYEQIQEIINREGTPTYMRGITVPTPLGQQTTITVYFENGTSYEVTENDYSAL